MSEKEWGRVPMQFTPYVFRGTDGEKLSVEIIPATEEDIASTHNAPGWMTDWKSAYLSDPAVEKYAMKSAHGELIALGAYQIAGNSAFVYILYVESAPPSNPVLTKKQERKYYGIGKALIAFGIKFSIDHGCRGDVVFDAKTDELARYYAKNFGARQIPSAFSVGPKRFMLADENAWSLFSEYLSEGE